LIVPPLAGGVTPLEDDDDPLAGLLDPALQLQQLDLQLTLDDLVLAALHPPVVGVALAPCLDPQAVGAEELAVVVPVLVGVLVRQVVEPPLAQVDELAGLALDRREAGMRLWHALIVRQYSSSHSP
jgi:hypothetical protein